MKGRKRLVSLLLAIAMLFTMLPVTALAVDEAEAAETVTEDGYFETEPEDEVEQPFFEEDNQEEPNEPADEITPTEENTAEVNEADVEVLPELPEEEVEGESVTEQAMGAVATSGSCGDNVSWELDQEGKLTISGSGEMSDYIQGTNWYDSRKKPPWYELRDQILTVDIQDGVTSVGSYAFYNCSNMKSVALPDSITSIRVYSFAFCHSLLEIYFPENVESIGSQAFRECYRLSSITLSEGVASIGDYVFAGCTNLSSMILPDSLTHIGQDAFAGCGRLKSLTIPANITSIEYRAFQNCTGLTTITIPSNVTSIEEDAFRDCSNLTSVAIPATVTRIEAYAFSGCSCLNEIDLPENIDTISNNLFDSCSSLSKIIVPDSVTSIGDEAFRQCRALSSITVPNSVTSLGSLAFSGCSSLELVEIGKSVADLDPFTFDECSSLTEINVDTGNQNYSSLGGVLFNKGCTTLLSFPNGKSGDYSIPSGVTSIGPYSFRQCSKLNSVTISNSVTDINSGAFEKCTGLQTVAFGNSVSVIGLCAFMGCSNLSSISLPGTLKTLGSRAFEDCTGLSSITFVGNAPLFKQSCFDRVCATAFYPAGDGTWTDSVRQNYCGTITWVAKDMPVNGNEAPGIHMMGNFNPATDSWSFNNSFLSFGGDGDGERYAIPKTRYVEVFGTDYYRIARSSDDAYKSMIPSGWGGNCYGMSFSAALIDQGRISLHDYNAGQVSCVNDYCMGVFKSAIYSSNKIFTISGQYTDVTRLIENYQVWAHSTDRGSTIICQRDSPEYVVDNGISDGGMFTSKTHSWGHNKEGNHIRSILAVIQASNEPLAMNFYWAKKGKAVGHSVLAYAWEREDWTVDSQYGWHKIYVYDPNYPMANNAMRNDGRQFASWYSDDAHYIELNPSENKWRYKNAAQLSSSNGQYVGCDASGRVIIGKYSHKKNNVDYNWEYPDLLQLERPSLAPASFDGTARYTTTYGSNLHLSPNSNITVTDKDGNIIASVYQGSCICFDSAVSFDGYYGSEQENEEEEGYTVQGGILHIPYDSYIIHYESGDDVTVIGTDSIINLEFSGDAEVAVDTASNSIDITSETDNDLNVQLTNLHGEDACTGARLDGTMQAGDTATVELQSDDVLVAELETNQADSSLDVYTFNGEEEGTGFVGTVDQETSLESNLTAIPVGNPQQVSLEQAEVSVLGDAVYSGAPITPAISVTLNGAPLSTDDYDVTFDNNTNAGRATLTVTGKGNYIGSASATFAIAQKEIGLQWENTEFTYDNSPHVPTVTATGLIEGDTCLVTVTGEQTAAGTYTAKATAVDNTNYKLPVDTEQTFVIKRAGAAFTIPDGLTATYGDTLADITLPDGWAWDAPTTSVGNAGEHTFSATFTPEDTSSYAPVTVNLTVTVSRAVPTAALLNVTVPSNPVYSGNAQEATAVAKSNVAGLGEITIRYNQNGKAASPINAGNFTIAVELAQGDNYEAATLESESWTFTIKPKEIGLTWSNTSFTYDGQNHSPTATATGLVNGDSCTVTVSGKQKNAGTHTATASGLSNGNYKLPSSKTQSFTIAQREVGLRWSNTSFTYDKKSHLPTATATGLVGSDTCTVTVSGAKTNAGTYTATATKLSNNNYKLPSGKTNKFTIKKAAVSVKTAVSVVKGKKVTLKLNGGGKATFKSSNKKIATVSSKGVVKGIAPGKVTITITVVGNSNYNKATKKVTVTVKPVAPVITSVSNVKNKPGSITVKWKAVPGVTGFEIQCCRNKAFKSGVKKTTAKASASTASLQSLTKNKTWYIRIRCYKTISGKKVYSAWSRVKSVKIPK